VNQKKFTIEEGQLFSNCCSKTMFVLTAYYDVNIISQPAKNI